SRYSPPAALLPNRPHQNKHKACGRDLPSLSHLKQKQSHHRRAQQDEVHHSHPSFTTSSNVHNRSRRPSSSVCCIITHVVAAASGQSIARFTRSWLRSKANRSATMFTYSTWLTDTSP